MSNFAVLGHRGMVGRAMVRALESRGQHVTTVSCRLDEESDAAETYNALRKAAVDTVFLCAARVGGIQANIDRPADMLLENLAIQNNVIDICHSLRAKLVFYGSSCIYPRDCRQPMREEYLLTGPLEPTNEAYAIAKIAGIKLCEAYARQYGLNYLAVMPCNLYGPHDNFRDDASHFVPALIRKLHAAKVSGAKSVTLWGTGTPRRELMHVDDLAQAVLHLVDRSATGLINVGTGLDATIRALAICASAVMGYHGEILWDTTKPDGTPRKLLDISRLESYGWDREDACAWAEGCKQVYGCYLENC
jgi:GDP-L-fucose synthase